MKIVHNLGGYMAPDLGWSDSSALLHPSLDLGKQGEVGLGVALKKSQCKLIPQAKTKKINQKNNRQRDIQQTKHTVEIHAKEVTPLIPGVALSFYPIPIIIKGRSLSEHFSFPISSILPLVHVEISSSIMKWITTPKQF